MPELMSTLALLASPFHVPELLTMAPPVLLRRFPVRVPVAELVKTALVPVLLTSPMWAPSFVTVPLFEQTKVLADSAGEVWPDSAGKIQVIAWPRLGNASPPANNIVPAIRRRQHALSSEIVRAESPAQSAILIAPPHAP
jgi:hypothetical protein